MLNILLWQAQLIKGDTKINKLLKQILLICVCVFALTGHAIAAPLSDTQKPFRFSDDFEVPFPDGFELLREANREADLGNYTKAAELFRPLAVQGNALAQASLGRMYYLGQGVSQDYTEAVKWFRLAAQQGYADAQTLLGMTYSLGQGVSQDYTEAVKWLRLAAQQGDANAQALLGGMYYQGKGVPQDYAEAVKWFRLAAQQGYASAQALLGEMYFHEQGVPQDYVKAHLWFNLAATDGNADIIKLRDRVAIRMTPKQIAEAQELAKKCTANKLKGCN